MKQFMKEVIRLDEWKPVDRLALPAITLVVLGAGIYFAFYVYSNWPTDLVIK